MWLTSSKNNMATGSRVIQNSEWLAQGSQSGKLLLKKRIQPKNKI